jgi:hypothetical protein
MEIKTKMKKKHSTFFGSRFNRYGLLMAVALPLQVLLFGIATNTNLDKYFLGSLFDEEPAAVVEEVSLQEVLEDEELTQLKNELEQFKSELVALREVVNSEDAEKAEEEIPVAVAPAPVPRPTVVKQAPVVKTVVSVPIVPVEPPVEVPVSVPVPVREQVRVSASSSGSVLVDDSTCVGGKAWLDARMNRECAQ